MRKRLSIYNGNVIHKNILDIFMLVSFIKTFDICMVLINWKLCSMDLTPVNYSKDKKCYWNFITKALDTVLGPFLYFKGKFQ